MKTLLVSNLLICLLIKVTEVFSYNVSVIEYMYQYDEQLSAAVNLEKNVRAHVKLIHLLKGKSELVVFPEDSLCPASGSDAIYFSVPEPSYKTPTLDSKILKIISEAAKHSNIYVVLSIPERAGKHRYSSSLVFRRNGTVAARYRKYHVGDDDVDRPGSPEMVYFDTDFNVRFGLFASMDLAFQSPALDLVKHGIKHFVHPTAWSSSLPYLIGNQAQQSWSWTHDVTLLAAGLNRVTKGQTGSGIYRGRSGHLTQTPIRYYTSNIPTTMVITAQLYPFYQPSDVPRRAEYQDYMDLNRLLQRSQNMATTFGHSSNQETEAVAVQMPKLKLASSPFKPYKTKLLSPDTNCARHILGNSEFYRCDTLESLCHGHICCQFDITVDYYVCDSPCLANVWLPLLSTDDSFYLFRYRMAVFDGVDKPWKSGDTLGLQVCSIVPCINSDISTCGKKPDPSKYMANIFTIRQKTVSIWAQSVSRVNITGIFTNNRSTLLMPSLLLGEIDPSVVEYNRFGMLSNHFFYGTDYNKSTLLLPEQNRNLGSVAIINRIFTRDGFTARSSQGRSSSSSFIIGMVLLTLILTFYRCCFMVHNRELFL